MGRIFPKEPLTVIKKIEFNGDYFPLKDEKHVVMHKRIFYSAHMHKVFFSYLFLLHFLHYLLLETIFGIWFLPLAKHKSLGITHIFAWKLVRHPFFFLQEYPSVSWRANAIRNVRWSQFLFLFSTFNCIKLFMMARSIRK